MSLPPDARGHRFQALTKNIRTRRGANVDASMSLEVGGQVHMDAMAFGMGACCLQITMQCRDERESRHLHDQLAVLSPLLLALSASTPICRGRLLASDTRWDIISKSVDDRTPAERGESEVGEACGELAGGGTRRLHKSRYSSVSRFIGRPANGVDAQRLAALNDLPRDEDVVVLRELVALGMDEQLAGHLAHLFTRDPLVIFDDTVRISDEYRLEHFENIQSTNWRTIRWKPPVVKAAQQLESRMREGLSVAQSNAISYDEPGWRVEFRPLEVQLTDFENAAWSIFVVLASRSILAMGYNFYLPMSLVEENMRRAQTADAVKKQTFYMRRAALDPSSSVPCVPALADGDVVELTLNEIVNGQEGEGGFPGLVPAILGYLESLGCNSLVRGRFLPYLGLIQKRAAGELPTTAQWIRKFVKSHKDYKGDGLVSPRISDDLIRLCDDVGMGRASCTELLGDVYVKPLYCEDPYSCATFADTAGAESVRGPMQAAPYKPQSLCSSGLDAYSVLMGTGPEPDTYLEAST
jgi:glutamate--cysteine ligase catalytic subunit